MLKASHEINEYLQDWDGQGLGSIISEICGFVVVLSGTILLHVTKDFDRNASRSAQYSLLVSQIFIYDFCYETIVCCKIQIT